MILYQTFTPLRPPRRIVPGDLVGWGLEAVEGRRLIKREKGRMGDVTESAPGGCAMTGGSRRILSDKIKSPSEKVLPRRLAYL